MRPSTGRQPPVGAATTLKQRRRNNSSSNCRKEFAFFVFCCCASAFPSKLLVDWMSHNFSTATVEVKKHSDTEGSVIINGDPNCVKTAADKSNPFGRGADRLQLGPCAYFFPQKQAPPKDWVHDIDYFFDRPGHGLEQREQCYLDCLRGLSEDEIRPSFLIRAAQMRLPKVVQTLMDDYGMDPLYKVTSTDGIPRLNAVQEAIHGGYPGILKTLTKGNIKLVIDDFGRTVEDYITMRASPIRPFHALKYFGIKVAENNLSPLLVFNDTELKNLEERQGWSSKTVHPYDDNTCDFDVVKQLSSEEFYREYLLPGRPVVIRDQASDDELRAFSKKYWETTSDFHPSSKHKVGPTAYPELTGQNNCDTKLSISEMENATECPTMPGIPMVHARHPRKRDLELLYPATNGEVINPAHSWAKLSEFFHVQTSHRKDHMQLFWGGEGSGATFHWHQSAFNILYAGLKEWRLAPPLFRGFTGMPALEVQLDANFSLRCTQKPGDLLWFPDYWGHMTINRRFSIGAAIIYGGYRDLNIDVAERVEVEGLVPRNEEQATTDAPPFFFVHVNKCGGTSMISMLNKHCHGQWKNEKWSKGKGEVSSLLRTFHCSAQCWIDRWGEKAWNTRYSFAIVRHPLARAVSNFFFLINQCAKRRIKICEERAIDTHYNGVVINDLEDDELKIKFFHSWVEKAYKLFPPGSHNHHLFGSHAHGNDIYSTFNATMTSWMVNADGEIAVDEVYRLEDMASGGMDKLSTKIPCLKEAAVAERFLAEQENTEGEGDLPTHVDLVSKNKSPPYPDYKRFAANSRTKEIFLEVFAADFHNFGYKWPDPDSDE